MVSACVFILTNPFHDVVEALPFSSAGYAGGS
jgi:hypothetical protein